LYFIVSWDISAGNPTWSQVDERLRNCFARYQSFRPVNTFYVVKVSSGDQYRAILVALQDVAKSSPVNVYFIISPLLTVTDWDGWLQPDDWPKVFQIAQ
jgi:hypothetical protein